jgi:LysM repeat protein
MQNTKKLLAIIFLFMGFVSRGQDQAVILNYINTYKNVAIAEMQRSGIPASITLAQGIHETLAGTSDLVIKSNNHFGIKCKDNWTGESVSHDDDARGECFRKYSSPEDSYRDHSNFLAGSPRYASLFKLDPLNYSAWAYGLKKAGYATNPRYPVILIRLIEDYHLQDYTLIAMGKKPAEDGIFVKTDATANENNTNIIPAVVVNEQAEKAPEADEDVDSKKSQYPEGEFKVNDTRVVFAEKGHSFLAIAEEHNISLSRIFDFNDLSETEMLAKDQLIYLQRKRKTGANEFHTVNRGETLYDIAQEEGIRMESLLEYNLLEKNMQPAAGQRLYLKTKAPERPALAIGNSNPAIAGATSSMEEKKLIAYRVQPKETIYAISKKYDVKIDDLVLWNRLTSYDLKTGQQLRIYK